VSQFSKIKNLYFHFLAQESHLQKNLTVIDEENPLDYQVDFEEQ